MNQSFMGRTSAQWVVMCLFLLLLVVLVAGLAHISYNEHGPKMVPMCSNCEIHHNQPVVPSGIDTPHVYLVSPPSLPAKKRKWRLVSCGLFVH
jgi:hypothetical protein